MADFQRYGLGERDIDQAITALKKGAYLLKYGRRGKPKFCPFRLSQDESSLIWYYGKKEKKIDLQNVTRILPGQRTAIFQRYPRPEKDYQSFSLLYDDRTLDLICKDKDEAEVWFTGLKALISRGSYRRIKYEQKGEGASSYNFSHRPSVSSVPSIDLSGNQLTENTGQSRLGKAFADIVSYTAANKSYNYHDASALSLNLVSLAVEEDAAVRCSSVEPLRSSVSSCVSCSSQSSLHEDYDSLGDCFIWGEGTGNAVLGGGELRINYSSGHKADSHLPKALESTTFLNVRSVAAGSKHALLVTKHGDIYSWGKESGGRLGHGVAADVSHPKLIPTLNGENIEMADCGEFHSCAITHSGDLYTWGDGTISCGLLGHGSKVSHWIPRKIGGLLEGMAVSYVSCGPWHTAIVTSGGQLFTFGDGTFGALGHGDHHEVETPREVEALKGLRSLRVACGAWHTAAVVAVITDGFEGPFDGTSTGKLFTWGDGDKGRLGHGHSKSQAVPKCIASLSDIEFTKVACGCDITVALSYSGLVYTMGSNAHGQLGCPSTYSMKPICIEGPLAETYVLEIACGSHHVAVLNSKSEVYTWGKGLNGQLGHGDYENRRVPTLVDSLKDKQVKSITCGSNFTAIVCLHKTVSGDENSVCSGCQMAFTFRRKKHNCYNCGLVFCHPCSSRKSMKASLAPNTSKPYRVCDDCLSKLQKAVASGSSTHSPKMRNGSARTSRDSVEEYTGPPRLRLSPCGSFKHEGRTSKSSMKRDGSDIYFSPHEDGQTPRESFPLLIPKMVAFGNPLSMPSYPIPVLRTTSPMSFKRSQTQSAMSMSALPVYASDVLPDITTQTCGILQKEIKYLKAQVEELACKSRHLEAELEKRSIQLTEATTLAKIESEQKQAAKEVTKSLSERVEELACKSRHLEAELEKRSIQLKEATTLAKIEAEEKQAAKEVIKSLSERLEEMENRVSEQRTTKRYSSPYSEHLNNHDDLHHGYIIHNQEDVNDSSNHQRCDHIAEGDMDLGGEQKLNDLSHKLRKHIRDDKSDLDAEKELNDPNHKLDAHITDDNLILDAEQKLYDRSNDLGKHRVNDKSDLNGEQNLNGLVHKPVKHIADVNSDVNAEEKRIGPKNKSAKHIADQDSDVNAEQKRHGHKHKHRKHIAGHNSDRNTEQNWNDLEHTGKHIASDNSDLNVVKKLLLPDEESKETSESTSRRNPSDSSTALALSDEKKKKKKKKKTHKQERMIQDEPGVYITLSALPSGGNELKRVRFSRKRFTQQQADKWWKENKAEVSQRHDIRKL